MLSGRAAHKHVIVCCRTVMLFIPSRLVTCCFFERSLRNRQNVWITFCFQDLLECISCPCVVHLMTQLANQLSSQFRIRVIRANLNQKRNAVKRYRSRHFTFCRIGTLT